MTDYDYSKNSYHVKLKYLPKHELQEALKTLDKVIVSGRSMSKVEFMKMMENVWESEKYAIKLVKSEFIK